MDVVINYWAVLGAALVNMVIGSLWYGPVFGKPWRKLMGFTPENMKSMGSLTITQAMIGGLITALVTSYVLAHFVSLMGVIDTAGALQFAFWTWLGLVATVQVGIVLWEGRPWKLFILNTLQSLVSLTLMVWILTCWP